MQTLGLPGRTGSLNKNTELSALNEIIKKLLDLKSTVILSGSGDATLIEQQTQSNLLTTIDAVLDLSLIEQQAQTVELTALTSMNSISHEELTDPSNVSFTAFKKLSFVCSGTIDVTVDGNIITYPYTLGTATILGSTFEVDTITVDTVLFNANPTGTVLVTLTV
jgi:hypothetical protein